MQTGGRSPLLDEGWRYVEKRELNDFRTGDWAVLKAQRPAYMKEQLAAQVVRLLAATAGDPTFGYQINNYRHCLQSATLALKDGRPEDYVVMALLHDIGFVTCNATHGAFAAQLFAPYVSEDLVWLLAHHQYFQAIHYIEHPDADRYAREKWRGHPCFAMTAEFVAKYDQCAIDPAIREEPLETFMPMVHRVFGREPRRLPLPD
ncbi:MAG: phosphohydrolase [Alphaproteobacteria bacterium]|nr:phosphohydrolase [Alphaproteobacteria bacterium]